MKEYFIAGIAFGTGIGCIIALLVNESWYKKMNELNNTWADFANQQNRDWADFAKQKNRDFADFAHEFGNAIANDILREAKNASSDVHDGGSGSEATSDSVSA